LSTDPRQVVLELGKLDLELPLGRDRVLGEDVEDELRPVDHPRVERVFEVALLYGIELVVDEEALGARLGVERFDLLELSLADVGALRRAGPALHHTAHWHHARGARELLDLGQLFVGIHSLCQNREDEPALGLGRTWNHQLPL
jgi:hypothetical protein